MLLVLALAVSAGCAAGKSGDEPNAIAVPTVTAVQPYAPFRYISPAQRATFRAYIRCAAKHGVMLEGPLATRPETASTSAKRAEARRLRLLKPR